MINRIDMPLPGARIAKGFTIGAKDFLMPIAPMRARPELMAPQAKPLPDAGRRLIQCGFMAKVDRANRYALESNEAEGFPRKDYLAILDRAFMWTPIVGLYWTGMIHKDPLMQPAQAQFDCVLCVKPPPTGGDYKLLAIGLLAIGDAGLNERGGLYKLNPPFDKMDGECIRLRPYPFMRMLLLAPQARSVSEVDV